MRLLRLSIPLLDGLTAYMLFREEDPMPNRFEQYRRKSLVVLYLAARYYAAFTLLLYGFAKVMGAQFTVLDSQLAKPLGDVSGFWLTWYYFGYSAIYSSLVAWTQILGALLLCFRRTALIGALLLLPVLINILGIDIWVIQFPLSSSALRNALYVLFALVIILAFHAPDLYRFLNKRRDDLLLLSRNPRWLIAFPILAAFSMATYQAHEAYWLANTNNRAPSPIDGTWHVVATQPVMPQIPEWMYFEYNRAHMVVFRFSDGRTETHDFRADPTKRTLTISQTWLSPGSEILDSTWQRSGDTMYLNGQWDNTISVQLTLERKQMRIKDHR